MENYLEQLNDSQREAVVNTEGPSLIVAGAGSGKTRVLTYRIAHLLANGVAPWNIMALTFTNKAAREMKERIGTIVGANVSQRLWMGTFHSIFARILRMEAERIKFPSSFTIYDSADSKSLIKSILKELQIKNKEYKPGLILSRISSAKNDLVLPGAYSRDQQRLMADRASKVPLVYDIYQRYMKACYKAGAMDFDDLLLNTNLLFRDNPDVVARYQDQFKYILVDEYQDTNRSQYLIVKKLAELHKNVCVVGDDAQSIYSFRGAKIENILNFRNDYPGYQLFKLEQNYRSTQLIVNAANSIISRNKGQIKKVVFSENEPGEKIRIFSAVSDMEEGFIVVNDLISRRHAARCAFSDFAILYRTNAQSRIFEEALRKNNIPYKIYGGLSFYQRKEIKDLLAYMRMAVNPRDGEALKRVINFPARGIGKTTLDKLEAAAASNDLTVWDILTHPNLPKAGFNAGTLKKLNSFVALVSSFFRQRESMDAYELTTEIVAQSGLLKEFHQDQTIEGQTRLENMDELLNGVKEFADNRRETGEPNSLEFFLEEVSLLTDQDNESEVDVAKVTLMTIHSAKGLEFPYVYIVGVEEGLFPSQMSAMAENDLEEERRLFYVAVTRAEKLVTLSFARNRFKYGESTFASPSRFLREMDAEYISEDSQQVTGTLKSSASFERREPRKKYDFSGSSTSRFNSRGKFSKIGSEKSSESVMQNDAGTSGLGAVTRVQVGVVVEHERFGTGKVIGLEGVAPNIKAIVEFKNAGKKQLLLKFAKLKILN
ncbi:ATP-dependent helicase [Natronoflexus pectinivorans]|uniref:DNA 3'-5' helicase n=1 Tax=Natronoflexus pectinivorans TaxID=682526 RepID=A0A4R2GN46_9BACT|nr:UvrD-helicase domain-containing protein [Natronoflexus pectinivorans]TCO10447.1 DNA helicase-2/ATP-dependent DNA helicase PcrA [Natronoflexus pectinivorans]